MKKNVSMGALVLAALLAVSCGNGTKQETSYTITGHIEGLADSTELQLVPMSHDQEDPIATTYAVNGDFKFEGSMEEPRCMTLLVKDCYGARHFMLENKQIKIEGTANSNPSRDGATFYNFDLKITGSPLTERFDSLVSVRDTLNAIRNEFENKYGAYLQELYKAMGEKDSKKVQELQNSEIGQACTKADSDFFQTVESTYTNLFLANKDTYWGPMLMLELTSYLPQSESATFEQFSQEAKDSYYGQLVKSEIYPAGVKGEPIASFTVKDNDGKEISLANLLEGKKYLLIDFWASWCRPCRNEIPNLKNLYKLYADKGFQIVSISIDKKKADWEKALKEEGLEWPNFLDETNVAKTFKVRAVPTMLLIDEKGNLVDSELRGEALATKLGELFNN